MRRRRVIPRIALSLAIGALGVLASPITSATSLIEPDARHRSQIAVEEGDAAFENGQFDEAISKYSASYHSLSPIDRASYVGSLSIRKAMRAYRERVSLENDPKERRRLLERQRIMLVEFLDAIEEQPGAADEVGQDVIAELEQIRAEIDQALGPTKKPEAEPQPTPPTAETTPPDPTPDETKQRDSPARRPRAPKADRPPRPARDWLGLGLVLGGGVVLGTGLGVSAGWVAITTQARDNADRAGDSLSPEAKEDYLRTEYARARDFLVAGSVLAVMGLVMTMGGVTSVVIHCRRRSQPAALTLAPSLGRDGMGLAMRGRF